MKECLFYIRKNNFVKCTICPHFCELNTGETGRCKSRKNVEGKLYSTAYANPCAIHVDPIEKKPLYHFYPQAYTLSIASAGCNLSCLNCQNASISQISPDQGNTKKVEPEDIINICRKNDSNIISYTYTEPLTYYEYTFDTSVLAHENSIKNVLVSAGFVNKAPLRKLAKYIDAANIDLKVFDSKLYNEICKGSLKTVLDSLIVLQEKGVFLELTNLIIPGFTDDYKMIRRMCNWLVSNGFKDSPLHFSRFFPSHKLSHLEPAKIKDLNNIYDIAKSSGINHVYLGNVDDHEKQNTYCPNCNKIIVERSRFNAYKIFLSDDKCMYCNEVISGVWK